MILFLNMYFVSFVKAMTGEMSKPEGVLTSETPVSHLLLEFCQCFQKLSFQLSILRLDACNFRLRLLPVPFQRLDRNQHNSRHVARIDAG